MKFALFFLAEYANMYVVSSIATVVFLGGWNGPFGPSFLWFFIKVDFSNVLLSLVKGNTPKTSF